MAWTKGLYEITGKLSESSKGVRDAARQAAVAAKQSETVKSAGPAMGKMAKFAMYPAGVGAGIGAGAYVAGIGTGAGADQLGGGIRRGFAPDQGPGGAAGGALTTLAGVAVLLLFAYGAVRLYGMVKAKE